MDLNSELVVNTSYIVHANEIQPNSSSIWSAFIYKKVKNVISLSVFSPASIAVGKYELTVDVNQQNKSYSTIIKDVYFFCNPWSKRMLIFKLLQI